MCEKIIVGHLSGCHTDVTYNDGRQRNSSVPDGADAIKFERIRRGSVDWDTEEPTEQEYQQVLPVITQRLNKQMEETRQILGG